MQRAGHRLIAGMDEVGRGALAGPVSVGVVVIDQACRSAPVGVKDSKLLSPRVRERLVPGIRAWAAAYAVGHASPAEIDEHGIMAALRLAGQRALDALPVIPDLVLLDGNQDWLTDSGQAGLPGLPCLPGLLEDNLGSVPGLAARAPLRAIPVRTMVKADLFCSSVAAASVLAKVERDAMMVALATTVPGYAWELNKGYSAPEHLAALGSRGPSVHHRRSWRLPGLAVAAQTDCGLVAAVPVSAGALMHDDGGVRTEGGGEQ
ncbi:MAG TPA: ribonuclease HII [Dermatophilaceae bacterium]|nr:ribonuclease HII [Dermatophilaceae bacterium]